MKKSDKMNRDEKRKIIIDILIIIGVIILYIFLEAWALKS